MVEVVAVNAGLFGEGVGPYCGHFNLSTINYVSSSSSAGCCDMWKFIWTRVDFHHVSQKIEWSHSVNMLGIFPAGFYSMMDESGNTFRSSFIAFYAQDLLAAGIYFQPVRNYYYFITKFISSINIFFFFQLLGRKRKSISNKLR